MVYYGYFMVHVFNEDHIVLHLTRILNLKHTFALKHKPITIDVMEITIKFRAVDMYNRGPFY